MVQVDNKVVGQIQLKQNLVDMVNKHLAKTLGSNFIGNVEQETYGYTRGPSYHVGDRLGYIAQVTNSEGILLKLIDRVGLRGGRAVQVDDFLFVGEFTDENGLKINVFPQYEEKMREFSADYEKERRKEVKVKVVESLNHALHSGMITFKYNLSKGRENSY